MRPYLLNPLFREISSLPGIGPKLAKLFERLELSRTGDLLFHLPSGYYHRRRISSLTQAVSGEIIIIEAKVTSHHPPRRPKAPYRILLEAPGGPFYVLYFHAEPRYLVNLYPLGALRLISGRLEHFDGQPQIVHPDFVGAPDTQAPIPEHEPLYPLTAGLTQRVVRLAVAAFLPEVPELPEWIAPALLRKKGWPSWREALVKAHNPKSEADLAPTDPARLRLAYDELFATQLTLALLREHHRKTKGRSLVGDGSLRAQVLARLPFQLTGAQGRALAEIEADLAAPEAMLRLLQGDVGSGKTILGLMAMLSALEAGYQAALMAPTEILAQQHLATLTGFLEGLGVEVLLLTGREKGKKREALLARLAEPTPCLVVGTHALFQDDITFARLGLAIIDEQHRFGVHQRLALSQKGEGIDILAMTATPIPRTFVMALYGDMDVSRLDEKPAGRKAILTRVLSLERLEEVLAGLDRALQEGARIYWICPLIEESEKLDLAAAEDRFRLLAERYPGCVGLVHGRMKAAEKDAVMADFAEGRLAILVATTVIEVGVDVPAASIMVIEHAERFGLSQLHQLRGRVGRSSQQSSCLLLYHPPLTQAARARLQVLRESDDGFHIAEEDLRLRGAGELLGTRQSGLPRFRLADPFLQESLLQLASKDAHALVAGDPLLKSPRGEAARLLLALFERKAPALLLRSG